MIAIIGGGISGLAAAYELAQRGVTFQLFEASARAGGLIHTERHDGFVIDAGPDSILSAKPAARALCEAVGLQSNLLQMIEPKTAYVLDRNQLYPLPSPSVLGIPLTLGAALRFRVLPIRSRLRLLFEPYVRPGVAGDESIASFFTRRLGAATVERVAQPLLGGIHAGDVEQLSVPSLFPALREAESRGGLLRHLGQRSPATGGLFNSLVGGMATLPAAIVQSLAPGTVALGTEVHTIAASSDGWRLETSSGTHFAQSVILATPPQATARLLATVDRDASRLCSEIPHASTVSIALAWPRDDIAHPLRGSGFVVARDRRRITASTWVSSKWPGRSPEGYTLLRAFVGGVRDPGAIDLSDDELVGIARRDLGGVLGIRTEPRLARVYRWRGASPQLIVGHAARVSRIERQLEAHPGLFVTGRGIRAVGIPDCVADARRVAASAAQSVMRSDRETNSEKYQHR
ncbi:MAG: protoporphyrinogen oxidase [Vicinamibacterales bacterium]